MKVILLKGHGRGITQIKFNREGDLLFTASKGTEVNLWLSDGERVGTYVGHTGAVYALDVNRASTRLITGGADNKVKVWDVESGKDLRTVSTFKTPVRGVSLSQGERYFLATTDAVLGYSATIQIFSFSDDPKRVSETPLFVMDLKPSRAKILDANWGPLNRHIFAATDDGRVLVFDVEARKLVHEITDNKKGSEVKRLTMSRDRYTFLTACTDHTARLYDSRTFQQIKVYETGRPCNSADFNPIMDHILLAGGQSASEVTTTRVDPTQFASRIHHKVFQEELALIPGHFGPVNDVRFNPDGQSFATGGEDGYVRLNFLDDSYFKGLSDDVYFQKINERVALR